MTIKNTHEVKKKKLNKKCTQDLNIGLTHCM